MGENKNTQKLLEKRYFLRDKEGKLLEHTWDDIAKRVGNNIAKAENTENYRYYSKLFRDKIRDMEFIPSSPCLFNAETPSQQLSSCFVLDVEDNIEGIFQTVAECAKIFQMSGGAGFSMRKIRPKGSDCKSSGSKASGVVSFMHVFNEVVNRVKQGNKRNGALKIDLPCDHPEIFDFIHSKDEQNVLSNMNISVSITEEFLNAVENNLDWDLKFKDKVYQTVKAVDLWNEIMLCAWKTGEPGISYQTNMNRGNMNLHIYFEVYGNPCHEFVNVPNSSCNLASANLTKVVENGIINWLKLKEIIEITFRFLDDMVTMNQLPLKKIEDMTKLIRPIGLGTMGFGQMLYMLKIPYASQQNLDFIDKLYSFINNVCLQYNFKLAEERGVYPAWKGSEWEKKGIKVRCSSMTSIAPNGSIAFIANTSGGIEPVFALVFYRTDNEGDEYLVVDSVFEEFLKETGRYSEEILYAIEKNGGSIKNLNDFFTKEEQEIFVVAGDISPEWHVKVLAQIQKYVSLSISKTVNLPNNATVEDVGNTYLLAGKLGVKGVTVYRDGCRENQVLSVGKKEIQKEEVLMVDPNPIVHGLKRGDWKKKAKDTVYIPRKIHIGCGKVILFIGWSESEHSIQDFYVKRSGQGGCERNIENMVISMSGMLRLGGNFSNIEKAFSGVGACNSFVRARAKGDKLSSGGNCGSAILNAIKDFLLQTQKTESPKVFKPTIHPKTMTVTNNIPDSEKCPDCGKKLIHESGCISCTCGYSKC